MTRSVAFSHHSLRHAARLRARARVSCGTSILGSSRCRRDAFRWLRKAPACTEARHAPRLRSLTPLPPAYTLANRKA
eukprot:756882-Pleurochrysis_carterae.AAC.1